MFSLLPLSFAFMCELFKTTVRHLRCFSVSGVLSTIFGPETSETQSCGAVVAQNLLALKPFPVVKRALS